MKAILESLISSYTRARNNNITNIPACVRARETMRDVLVGITEQRYNNEQIAALLTALALDGVKVDDLLGFRDGILQTGVPVKLDAERYIDIVGTGGDGKNTFNISTCSCFVVAGAGYKVAKHGNVSATSVSGASNVIQLHGVQFTDDVNKLNKCLNECNFVYLHAPLFARAMKFVAPIRKNLGFPTIFNLLGPLVNPSQPKCQMLGVAKNEQLELYAEVCEKLGQDYVIVTSTDGYDEISLTSDFRVKTKTMDKVISPAELGLKSIDPSEIYGGNTPEEACAIFDAVLENRATEAQKSVVIANSALAIHVYSNKPLAECIAEAENSINSGAALNVLKKYIELMK